MHKLLLLCLMLLFTRNGICQYDAPVSGSTDYTLHSLSTKDSWNKVYVRGGLGYGSPITGEIVNTTTNPYNVKSYTSGLNAVCGIGYGLSKNVAFELNGLFVVPGAKYTFDGVVGTDSNGNNIGGTIHHRARDIFLLMPGVVFQTQFQRFQLYTRLALALPFISRVATDNHTVDDIGIVSLDLSQSVNYTMHFTLGFSAALGGSLQLNEHLKLWVELNALSFSPYLKQATVTSSILNGRDNLGSYTGVAKMANYSLEGSYSIIEGQGYKANASLPTNTMPMSNIGMQAGVSFNFGNNMNQNTLREQLPGYFYCKAGLGYAVPFVNSNISGLPYNGSQSVQYSYEPHSSSYTGFSDVYHEKRASLSAGINATAGGGYMFTPHLGVEVDLQFGVKSKVYSEKYAYNDTNGTAASASITTYAKNLTLLTPSIVLKTGGKIVEVYSRLGLAIPISNKFYQTTAETDASGSFAYENEFTVMPTLGYSGALGVTYRLGLHLNIWAELNVLSWEPYVKESHTVYKTINGVPQPGSDPAEKYYFHIAEPADIGGPALTYSVPYSSVGFWAGVGWRF